MSKSIIPRNRKWILSMPLAKATMLCMKAYAAQIRKMKTLRPDQLADWIENHSHTMAIAIYEESQRQAEIASEHHRFMMGDPWIKWILEEERQPGKAVRGRKTS